MAAVQLSQPACAPGEGIHFEGLRKPKPLPSPIFRSFPQPSRTIGSRQFSAYSTLPEVGLPWRRAQSCPPILTVNDMPARESPWGVFLAAKSDRPQRLSQRERRRRSGGSGARRHRFGEKRLFFSSRQALVHSPSIRGNNCTDQWSLMSSANDFGLLRSTRWVIPKVTPRTKAGPCRQREPCGGCLRNRIHVPRRANPRAVGC